MHNTHAHTQAHEWASHRQGFGGEGAVLAYLAGASRTVGSMRFGGTVAGTLAAETPPLHGTLEALSDADTRNHTHHP